MSFLEKYKFNGKEYVVGGDFVSLDANDTITQKKTFLVVPKSLEPVSDNDLTTKKYVDEETNLKMVNQMLDLADTIIIPSDENNYGVVKMYIKNNILYISTNNNNAFQ